MMQPFVTLPLLLLSAGSLLKACLCPMNTPPCQGYWQSSAVFAGMVTQRTSPNLPAEQNKRGSAFLTVRFAFSVVKAYRGDLENEVQVSSGLGGGDCGYPFRVGERYLVYAYVDPETKELSTSICTLTKPLVDAGKDLDYIRTLKTEPAGTRLYGSVHDFTRTRTGSRITPELLAGAGIELKTPQSILHQVSDKDGTYEWKGLQAGKYQMSVKLENYLSLSLSGIDLNLPGEGCFALDLAVESNGQIEGRVLDDQGNPQSFQRVELADSEGNGLGEFHVETDQEGHYQFSGVRPGDFLLGVNLSSPPDAKSAIARTYFPNALTRENAVVVHLSKADRLIGHDIHVSRRTESRPLRGVIFRLDGKPAANATITLVYPDYPWHSDSQRGPDAQGRFSIEVRTNLRTILWVQAPDARGIWMNAGQVELPTEGPIQDQILSLSHEPKKFTPSN
jgi:hypothetical protein